MKALYFDCSSGISGNMTLGALLEITQDLNAFLEELNKLHIDGYHIDVSKKVKNGITGTYVDVVLEEHDHDHHGHHHAHRHLGDINKIIDDSDIDPKAKQLAKKIFLRVAQAESKVHGEPLEKVHFHEVGAIDSIVDIVGTAILISQIDPDIILSSVVNDGYGFIECAHGTMSVPVPATTEIFACSDVVSKQIDEATELVTPTGAAIIAELAKSFGPMPAMNVKKVGWGAGFKDLKIPNVLKVSLAEMQEKSEDIVVMETNIDDCTGEILGYTMECLFEAGALDVFFTPIFMKKNRPAYRLTVACHENDLFALQKIIFRETTTIGIRYRYEKRNVLKRKAVTIDTHYGPVQGKEVTCNQDHYTYLEYDSVKALAKEKNISIKEIYQAIKK